MRAAALALLIALPLTACGPVSREQAERDCYSRARLAKQPRGEVGVGIDSEGRTHSSLKLSVSSDFIQGRDPAAVYDACVYQKSGQMPSQPLYTRPDWRD